MIDMLISNCSLAYFDFAINDLLETEKAKREAKRLARETKKLSHKAVKENPILEATKITKAISEKLEKGIRISSEDRDNIHQALDILLDNNYI